MILRALTAAGVLASGLVHLWLWHLGFRDIPVIGPLFLLNAVVGVALPLPVLLWRHWLPLLLAVGFSACTLGAFLLSATVGLFGMQEVLFGTWQDVAGLVEVVSLLAGSAALVRENLRPPAGGSAGGSAAGTSAGYVDPRGTGRPGH